MKTTTLRCADYFPRALATAARNWEARSVSLAQSLFFKMSLLTSVLPAAYGDAAGLDELARGVHVDAAGGDDLQMG